MRTHSRLASLFRFLAGVIMVAPAYSPAACLAQATGSVGVVQLRPFVIGLQPVVSRGAVGGVLIDAQGVVRQADAESIGQLQEVRQAALEELAGDLGQSSPLRKISLKRLQAALADRRASGVPISDEMRFLAGVQRIRYVLAYPETADIVLAGPAEPWHVDEQAHVVGSGGRPVMLLDDLVVALRSAEEAEQSGISCSIDPTQEGLQRLQEFVAARGATKPDAETVARLEQELGPQEITLEGVSDSTHFARVLVAADYRMKRLAMNLDRSPVRGLPNYLALAKASGRGVAQIMPRWWLAADYEPLLTDRERLAWELSGRGVKALTEDDLLAADGTRRQTGTASAAAAKWAANMTTHYDELSLKVPIFGELRNLMDLAVVAALVVNEDLADRTGCSLDLFLDPGALAVAKFEVPKSIDSKASLLHKGKQWLICVSGGVAVDSWEVIERVEESKSTETIRAQALPPDDGRWWWD